MTTTRLIIIAKTLPAARRAARLRGRNVQVVALATPRSLDRLRGVTADMVLSVDALDPVTAQRVRDAYWPCMASASA